MRLVNQYIVRTAAILALTAASTSAFAQSAEYRRGYDDGYAAGQRAAGDYRDDRGRGQDRGGIRIESAQYGTRGAVCDARQAVRRDIGRNGGAVLAGNHLCGDPARGVEKRLSVVYRCDGDQPMQVVARENETLRLMCRR